jgi:aryl-alcohol dehydrogenase-like predicted oxidoreductase
MIDVGKIGFGGMPLSIQGRPSEEQGRRVLQAAIDAGITFFDTADVYCLDDSDIGHNERLIESVVRDRDDVHVGTKAGLRRPRGAWTRDGSPKHIREACEQSLRSLGLAKATAQIWLYQLHAVDSTVGLEKSVETFAELQREGKCKHVGLSNVSIAEIERAKRIVDVKSVQNRLNPYFRESIDVAQYCGENDIVFLAYSPVGGGRLTKKLPKFEVLQEIATKHERSPHAIVLAWVRTKGKTVVPIPGARTVEHAVDSARSAELTLTPDEVGAIDSEHFDVT